MVRTRGGGIGTQGKPRGRLRGRGAHMVRMDIVERGENVNRRRNVPRDRSPLETSVGNERSNRHEHGTKSEHDNLIPSVMVLNFNVLR